MDNPEKLATLWTQDIGQIQTKQKTQHMKLKRWVTRPHQKPGMNPVASYKSPNMLLISSICVEHHYTKQTLSRNIEYVG